MNLTDNPRLRLITLCGLYVAQGIPFGFVTITLKNHLAAEGLGVGEIGVVLAMVTWPWALKWLWGPVIDRFGLLSMGRRRPWILLAQTLMALTFAMMIATANFVTRVNLLSWMVLIHNVFASLQDVSTDALAVDLLREEERGRANGLMYGSSYLGTFLGGGSIGAIVARYGMRVAMSVLLAILLAIILLPLLLRERPGERLLPWTQGRSMVPKEVRAALSLRGLFLSLGKAFSLRSTLLGAALALTVKLAFGVLLAVSVVLFTQELGWKKEDLIRVEGGYGVWLGLAGSIAGGFLADRVGARLLAGIATALLGSVWIAFGLVQPLSLWHQQPIIITLILSQEVFLSVLTVSLFALFMGISWPLVAGTQFTAYMAMLNLSQTMGATIAGPLSKWTTPANIYLCAGVFQIALVFLLPLIDPHQTRRVLRLAGGDA